MCVTDHPVANHALESCSSGCMYSNQVSFCRWAGAQLDHTQVVSSPQQLYTYSSYIQDGAPDKETSWPPQGYILAPQPQQQILQPQPPQQHTTQPHQQHPAMYGQTHEPVHAVPQVLQHMRQHAAPVQYTNTFVRESVPGNPSAAHCSLQTDLCGAVWPLNQPFPIIAPSTMPSNHHAYAVLHSAQGWAGSGRVPMHASHAGGMHVQQATMQGHSPSNPSATLADSNIGSHSKASQLSTQSTVAALHMHGSMMPTPDNDGGAAMGVLANAVATSSNQNQVQPPVAENAPTMNHQPQQQQQSHQQHQRQAQHPGPLPVDHKTAVYQPNVKMEIAGHGGALHSSMQCFGRHPSPPASPPPELVDLPFDFGKFDELEHAQCHAYDDVAAHSGQSKAAEPALNDMDSIFDVPAITDSEDLFKLFTHDSQGNPMITSHIHQRHDDPSSHELEFVANGFHSAVNTTEFDVEGCGASVGDCRMAETDPTLGSYVSALGVASTS